MHTTTPNTPLDTLRRLGLRAILPVLLAFGLAACDADMDDEGAMLSLEIQPMVGASAFHPGTVYPIAGTDVALDAGRIYVSEVTLLREDGSAVTFTGTPVTAPAKENTDANAPIVQHTVTDRVMLFKHDIGDDTFELGEAPAGTYTGIRFKIGLDGMTNRIDPTAVADSHPLAKQTDRNNHWSWNSGYLFARIDGAVDADGDGVGDADSQDHPATVQMHLGTTAMARSITLNETFTLKEGAMQRLHLMLDYAALFDGISYADGSADARRCHTMPCMAQATRFANNFGRAFVLHGIHDSGHSHGM